MGFRFNSRGDVGRFAGGRCEFVQAFEGSLFANAIATFLAFIGKRVGFFGELRGVERVSRLGLSEFRFWNLNCGSTIINFTAD